MITRVSENYDPSLPDPLGCDLSEVLGEAAHLVRRQLDFSHQKKHVLYGVKTHRGFFDVFVSDAGAEAIIELLPCAAADGRGFVEQELNEMIPHLLKTQNQDEFFSRAAVEFRTLTGYDRVMIYRFDEDYNGQVIAESHADGMESYLGLHYPASDIPAQARELYRKNMIRTIPDACYRPASIRQSSSAAPLDMSHSTLRSVSPIHLEYLKNMNVAATLTVSLIVHGGLWGLVSCHHRAPFLPDMRRIGVAEVFGNVLGAMIQTREDGERERVHAQLLSRLDTVMDIVTGQDRTASVMDIIAERSALFHSLLPSDGFLFHSSDRTVSRNFPVSGSALDALVERLGSVIHGSIFCTDHLAGVLPGLEDSTLRSCAGLIALQLETNPRSLWLWRRAEKTQTISWGGDPNQKVILSQQGLISPRKSFTRYNETVTMHSAPWNNAEQDLPRFLIAQIYRLFEFFQSTQELESRKKQIKDLEDEKARHYEELIEMLVGVIEQRDAYTAGHTRRVAEYCVAIARQMQLPPEDVSRLREAAILHDIGKVIIPDSILLKPGRLSFKEYELIKAHLEVGYQILSRIDYYKPLAEIIRCHHERYDGTGYPDKRKGPEIPLLSHIMIVADAFDAMTTNRIYQARKSTDDAIAELLSLRGIWYHPEVVDAAVIAARSMQAGGTIPSQLPLTQMEKERFAYFFRDQLTGLYNGTYLWMVLNALIPDMHCNACALVELRGMSAYNDRFGWHEGNSLLRRFAEALSARAREDQIFRVFGDDFVVCFDEIEGREAFLRAWTPLEIEGVTATCRAAERTMFLDIV